MKLTKEEIKYIDNYLIKNEVKYWDVRLELLDHIVSAVEDKIENEGISLNEALLEVHHGFGNRIHNGYSYELDFEKALFIDNKGFKKFTLKKQKEIGRKQRWHYWNTFLPFIISSHFLLELLALILVMWLTYSYFDFKAAFFVLLGAIVISEFSKIFIGGFKKFKSKSLNLQMAFTFVIFYTQAPYWFLNIFNWYFEDMTEKPYIILLIALIVVFVFSRHSLNTYKYTYNIYKKRYDLLIS